MSKRIPVVILTYHRYSELWQYTVKSILDNLYCEVFIITDKSNISGLGKDVKIIETGKKVWHENLKKGIEILIDRYSIEYAIFTFDDLLITKVADESVIQNSLMLISNDYRIASIKLSHTHLGSHDFGSEYREVKQAKYKTTLVFAVWNLRKLIKISNKKLNPWEFEKYGYKYIDDNSIIISTKKNIIEYFNAIVKGKAVKGGPVDLNTFKKMNYFENLHYKTKKLSVKLKNLFKVYFNFQG